MTERQADWAVADHMEVLMLAADRPKTYMAVIPTWETEPKPTRRHFKSVMKTL